METGPYQRALLHCGITTKVDVEDERIPILQQAMEYTGAMGTMVMDELVYVHEWTETGLGQQLQPSLYKCPVCNGSNLFKWPCLIQYLHLCHCLGQEL